MDILLYFGICLNFAEFVIGIYYSVNKADGCTTVIPYGIWMIIKSLVIIFFYIDRIIRYKLYISILLCVFWFIWIVFGMLIFFGDCSKHIPVVAQVFTYSSLIYNLIVALCVLNSDKKKESIRGELQAQLIDF